ncbi:MAG: DUF3987 domain-containing protein [Paludibacteraceae bacterium]|nr:DUF3987 domain-containing protein [Paludibacteraceae bacterium]
MYPRICIQPSISSGKPTPVTWSQIELAMRQPAVQDICDQIKLLDGKDPDELARLKRQLPVITPHACRFRGDGSRKSDNAVPSGLVMLDIDHIDDPRDFFSTHIFPVLSTASTASELPTTGAAELQRSDPKIYFVAITPSGHGIRVIAEREPEESIPAAQKRLAALFALSEFDAVTKDLARASFLMPWSYVLYCEPSGLDFDTPEKEAVITTHFAQVEAQNNTITLSQERKSQSTTGEAELQQSDLPTTGEAELQRSDLPTTGKAELQQSDLFYRGIPYADIVRELIFLLGGEPAMGERNQFYFTLVRYMRYICNFDPDMCVRILPDFGLSLSERCSTAQSSVNRPRKGDIPDLLNRAITTASSASELPTTGEAELQRSDLSLPPLPRVLELICRRLPERFRPAMVIASLPILGALATRVRFQYLDKQVHSFSFMSCITAPAATGKSFIRKPVNLLLTPIDRQDEIERKKEEEYKDALRAAKNSKMQPTNPRACPRNNGINVSIAKLLQLLAYSEGKHLIGIGEEIDTLVKSERAGVWSQKSDIYRLGFDNAKYGQNYMSDNSFSANVPVYYNLLLTGTPGGMYRFFRDVEDGLVTRFCFAQLPDMFGSDIPAFENYTAAEEEEIIDIAETLDKAAGTIACSHVGVRIRRWLNDKRDLAIREDSRAIDTLRKRAAVIGYRAGMLAYLLNECVYTKEVGQFTSWVAEYVFQNQMELFGSKFEEVAQTQIRVKEKCSHVVSLLQALPEQFTRAELMALRARNGQSTNVAMVISRWRSSGFITQVEKNTYKKTLKCQQ